MLIFARFFAICFKDHDDDSSDKKEKGMKTSTKNPPPPPPRNETQQVHFDDKSAQYDNLVTQNDNVNFVSNSTQTKTGDVDFTAMHQN